ncbi:spermidine/putrescine ABC transporter substrate-binding protein [Romeria aff. gracilis LEGE 07310]|uniref:Spermidine/putrescine ABC transporter substrate-binding protein n=1 Tax=Vasconcelosia minhoensis LEGE 07310 TaxID=915328 RepID=A0A8J7DDZ3_9CYAN|nr:spermidine/putrescine ABC transporter substrate-binding protein [Romeria gracilis]MBE9079313.1 spermidine/putrescine ABC transporter substrate-binding protein [Romeria aff. gracilis LEGE 07310]
MPRRFSSKPRLAATRRHFLQGSAAAIAGIALSNCGGVSDVQSSDAGAEPTEDGDAGSAASGASGPLYIYTWADYTDDQLVQRFRDKTGIDVQIDIYDSNETMLAKMQAGGGDNYSVIYPSDYMVTQMIDMGMLTEFDKSRLQGLDQLSPKWESPGYDPDNSHSVPYSWGTTGLIYNSKELSTAPADWTYLWDNKDALSRRMTMLDDVRETLGAVLHSLGYSYNSTDPAELEAAYQRLLELKPALASFKSFGWQDELLGGDLLLAMAFSVEAIPVTLEDDTFQYVIPASGSSVWTDTMVIPTTAPNADAAYEWINFNLNPDVSAETVKRLYFATPNAAAKDMLPEELLSNQDLFPSEELLAKCEGIAPVGDAIELYDRYWTQITSA